MPEFELHEEGTVQLRPAGGPYSAPDPVLRPPTVEAMPLGEAFAVLRPGDHLIVRVDADISRADAADIQQRIRDRLPQLADVTVINAAGLAVYRDEANHG